jgi:hypothetical protein
MNKRKAMIGWLVYTGGATIVKRMVKSKAKAAVPGKKAGSRRPNFAAILAGVGAAIGALLFWRSRGSSNDYTPS